MGYIKNTISRYLDGTEIALGVVVLAYFLLA